jgi:flavin-binding protein dodecin
MGNTVYRVIEVVGSSASGLGDAITNGIDRAGKTLENLDWFEVSEIRGHIADQKVAHYQVTMKVGFAFGTEDRDAPIQFPHRSLGVLRWTRASHGPVPPMRQPRGARRRAGPMSPRRSPTGAVQHAVAALTEGRLVVVVDDADREDEGDLVVAAEFGLPPRS